MVFSSPIFLFFFLPIVLALHAVTPRGARNVVLLAVSLVFYAWGEPRFVVVLAASAGFNYFFGVALDRAAGPGRRRVVLALAVVFNVGLLIAYKYANFLADNLNRGLSLLRIAPFELEPIALPLGISFFTFHALSYVIDVYRGTVRAQTNPIDIGLYLAFFPQLIAGPIVRYHELADQLRVRLVTRHGWATGVRRFVVGLGKKVLIANTVAVPADAIFALPPSELTTGLSWLAITCYTLQIYFDFSGYSDMAIGLAHMLGFRFPENFDYPYTARSVTEFWRRWHISLSRWFRDYVYVPLGGNRISPGRTYANLVTVFFLCGLWHGASWNFVVWGLFHGLFLVLERRGLARWIDTHAAPLRHVYLLGVVMIGWVLFRAPTLQDAAAFLGALAGAGQGTGIEHYPEFYLTPPLVLALIAGIVGSVPWLPRLARWRETSATIAVETGLAGVSVAALSAVLLASAMALASGTYNPFIYFRF